MWLLRTSIAAWLLALGLVVGVAAVFVHATWWGLPLTAAAVAATLVALPGGWWLRLPFAAGVAGAVALLTPPRPEGDYVVAGDLPGYLLLGGALVVLLSGLTGLRPRAGATSSDPASSDAGGGPTAP